MYFVAENTLKLIIKYIVIPLLLVSLTSQPHSAYSRGLITFSIGIQHEYILDNYKQLETLQRKQN